MDLLTSNYKKVTLIISFICATLLACAQTFDASNSTAWENAGLAAPFDIPTNEVNILDFGADNTGSISCKPAYISAISSLNGAPGTIYFPEGTYFFDAGISIPNNTVLKGASVQTILKFDLGGNGDAIRITGTIQSDEHSLAEAAAKGTHSIELNDASAFQIGDLVRLGLDDEDIMYSSWAYGTLGQVNEIIAIDGNVLDLADPLNRSYELSLSPYVRRIEPRRNAGITCFKIVREDASTGQTDNIHFRNAFNCFVRNVKSVNCNFGHITVQSSAHILIENSYLHHAHAYGGGGQAYGIVFQEAASFNLAQNNSFEHLRHSMLLQSGANGNVFGYNYSIDPFWVSGFLPANSAGDAVLHGNHPYLNLFEGNVIQNIVVDASHGTNGPHNTFLRNRAELYGFFSDAETPSDSMNIVGNEITNSGFPYGLFMVNGDGHLVHGNNVNGNANPSGTNEVEVNSLYLDEFEDHAFLDFSDLPFTGYPLNIDSENIPAQQSYLNGTPVACGNLVTDVAAKQSEATLKLIDNEVILNPEMLPATFQMFAMNGKLMAQENVMSSTYQLPTVKSSGLYLITVVGPKDVHTLKVLIAR